MRPNSRFRRAAAWLAILAGPLAYANVGLALVAIGCDLTAFGDTALGFRVAAGHPYGAELIRWSMLSDMLGFYLFLIPLALVWRAWLRERSPLFTDFCTLCGLGYLFFGALGAVILSVVVPLQMTAYAGASAADRQIHETVLLAFSYAIYDGVWGTLNPLLAGMWWTGLGWLLRREQRLLGWTTVALGIFMLLRDVKVGPVALIALGAYFILAPIWAAWLGGVMLRQKV